MAQIQHRIDCNEDFRRHSGYADNGENFKATYGLGDPFNLECLGCCFAYLKTRDYQEVVTTAVVDGSHLDKVRYSGEGVYPVPVSGDLVNCYVKAPGGRGKRGQISTGPDLNLGEERKRLVANFRTYQMYTPAELLSIPIGFPTTARLESVSIDVIKPEELGNIYLNYADAALTELYREIALDAAQGHTHNKEVMGSLSQPGMRGYLLIYRHENRSAVKDKGNYEASVNDLKEDLEKQLKI